MSYIRILFILYLLIIITGTKLFTSNQTIRIASFNIHYIVPSNSNENWEKRKYAVSKVLNKIDADIIAFQEMETFEWSNFSNKNIQLDWVLQTVPGYKVSAIGNPEEFPITQPVIYRENIFEAVDQGFFFFSKTPDVIYSKQWNGRYPYFATWVKFKIKKTGVHFTLFNIHNDFLSLSNQRKTSELIIKRIKPLLNQNQKIIITGDFNAPIFSKTVRIITDSGMKIAQPAGSTNHFNFGVNFLPAIDHFFVSDTLELADKVTVWRERYKNIWPSDHYPISVDIIFP
jgi:endonuclease/exonuclease/phosphatase family metal-dependent hydrolase